ncbi:Mu-like prophage major head subunit gpT family protein [bacterium]|nr:Mu-like prophage major head subunit gpT family protein [bacterium]
MDLTPETFIAINKVWTAIYQEALRDLPTWHKRFITQVTRMVMTNIYTFTVKRGGMTEWIGDRTMQNLISRKIELTIREWQSSIEFEKKEIKYDQIGNRKAAVEGLAMDKIYHEIDLVVDWLLNGHNASGYNGYDEKPFFNAAHPIAASAKTFTNYYDDLDLDAEGLYAARQGMRLVQGDDGRSLSIKPVVLWHSAPLEGKAEAVIKKQLLSGGESNLDYQRFELLAIDELGDVLAWGLLDPNKPMGPLLHHIGDSTDPRMLRVAGDLHKTGIWGFDQDDNMGGLWWQTICKAIAPSD